MALSPRLDLRQSQTLVMTPQLQQAIKLLQLNNVELTEYVEQELEQNPLLERGEGDDFSESPADAAPDETPATAEPAEIPAADDPGGADNSTLDMDYDNVWNNDSPSDNAGLSDPAFADWRSRSGGGGGFDEDGPNLEQTLSGDVTLRDHLAAQLSMEIDDPVDRVIGLHLIDMLDESGYVVGSLEGVAAMLECDPPRVERALLRVQHFDPPGIFARDLAECLALQLRDRDRLDPAMQALLENLDLLAKRDVAKLKKVCGVDDEDLVDMVAEIRALDPKPALAFDHSIAQPVTPDVIMRPNPAGGWLVELNNDTLPRVLVNNHYFAEVSEQPLKKEDKQYLAERLQSANWLVKSLDQRANTILKVAAELVRQQDAFFARGVQHLKPLVLRDIAEVIEMHESTVSRVTSNKYIASPRGIFEMKYFFTTAIASTDGGEAHSAESIRQRIKAMIDEETAKTVLSDDKIVAVLKGDGVDIARRTVAKYREAMGIPSSVQRRREKGVSL